MTQANSSDFDNFDQWKSLAKVWSQVPQRKLPAANLLLTSRGRGSDLRPIPNFISDSHHRLSAPPSDASPRACCQRCPWNLRPLQPASAKHMTHISVDTFRIALEAQARRRVFCICESTKRKTKKQTLGFLDGIDAKLRSKTYVSTGWNGSADPPGCLRHPSPSGHHRPLHLPVLPPSQRRVDERSQNLKYSLKKFAHIHTELSYRSWTILIDHDTYIISIYIYYIYVHIDHLEHWQIRQSLRRRSQVTRILLLQLSCHLNSLRIYVESFQAPFWRQTCLSNRGWAKSP